MHKYDFGDIESSTIGFSDSGSNWSRSAKKKLKSANKTKNKNKSHQSKNPNLRERRAKRNLVPVDFHMPQLPRLCLNKYRLRLSPSANLERARKLVDRINTEAELVAYLWPRCQRRTQELETELAELQQCVQKIQVETIAIKRKRWCRVCQKEASYVHAMRFFCSATCELNYTHNPVDTIPPIL